MTNQQQTRQKQARPVAWIDRNAGQFFAFSYPRHADKTATVGQSESLDALRRDLRARGFAVRLNFQE